MSWRPGITSHVTGEGYRIMLQGVTYGNGDTVEDAEDNLILRLLNILLSLDTMQMSSGLKVEPQVMQFLYQLAEFARAGGDIREKVLT